MPKHAKNKPKNEALIEPVQIERAKKKTLNLRYNVKSMNESAESNVFWSVYMCVEKHMIFSR